MAGTKLATTQHPCNFCDTWVSSVSRQLVIHYEKCTKIPLQHKATITSIIESHKNGGSSGLNKNISPFVSKSMSMLNIDSPQPQSKNTNASVSCTITQGLPLAPRPSKKRKLSSGIGVGVNGVNGVGRYFTRNINKRDFQYAMRLALRAHCYSPILQEEYLCRLFTYICPSFSEQLGKVNIEMAVKKYKQNLKHALYKILSGKHGLIGLFYHSASKEVSVWILCDTSTFFIFKVAFDDVFAPHHVSEEEEEQKEQSISLNDHGHSNQFDELLSTLDDIKFEVLGMKVNSDILDDESRYPTIAQFAESKQILMIGNIKHKWNSIVQDIITLDSLVPFLRKLETLLTFINCIENFDLKLILEAKYKASVPTTLLQGIDFILTVKVTLRSELANDSLNTVNTHIKKDIMDIVFVDVPFWDLVKLCKNLFEELLTFKENVVLNKEAVSLGHVFGEYKTLIDAYKTTEKTIYNQLRFKTLQKEIIRAIKRNLFPKSINDQNDVLKSDCAIYYLSYFMQAPRQTGKVHQIRMSNKVLELMTNVQELETVKQHYLDLRCARGCFDELFECFDELRGSEYNNFAELCLRIVGIDATPLEFIIDCTVPHGKDLFCHYNSKCDRLFQTLMQ